MKIEDFGGPKVLDVDQFDAWINGRGSPFEARVAALAGVVPPPNLKFLSVLLELARVPETATALQDVIEEASRDPSRGGRSQRLRSARRVWRSMFVDPPRKRATGLRNPGRDFSVWNCFHVAWARRRPKLSKDAIIREFVAKDGMRKFAKKATEQINLTSTFQLEAILARVERHWPDQVAGWRARILSGKTARHQQAQFLGLHFVPP